MSWQNFLVEALLAILEKRGGWNVNGRMGKSFENGESSPNVGSIKTSKTNGVTLLWLFRPSSEWKDLDSGGLGPTNSNLQINMHVLIIFIYFFVVLIFTDTSYLSLSSSSEVLYFDSGGLGLQQWNRWWVFLSIWHLRPALFSLYCLLAVLVVAPGRHYVEGQGRKFILPIPHCPFPQNPQAVFFF